MKPRQEKQVQIPLRLLYAISDVLEGLQPLIRDEIHPDDEKYIQGIRAEITAKFEAMERHNLFSAYKSAEQGTAEREYFRLRYLDEAGVHKSFRTDKETEI